MLPINSAMTHSFASAVLRIAYRKMSVDRPEPIDGFRHRDVGRAQQHVADRREQAREPAAHDRRHAGR